MKAKYFLIVVLIILIGIIIIQNTQVAAFQLLFWKVEMSRAILMPIIFITGLIIGFLGGMIFTKRKQ
jgi:uncharacterized integral membrane protein